MDNITQPGIRFRAGADGLARPMPSYLVEHHVARLTASAEELGLTRTPGAATTGPVPTPVGAAAEVARYVHLADDLGIGASGSTGLPSMGRG